MGSTRNVLLRARDSDFISDSNWWLCYIILALIPVVFFCVACYSVWRDRRTRTKFDIEAINATYSKFWSNNNGARNPAETRRPAGFPQTREGQYVSTLGRDRAGPKTQNGFPASAPTPNASYNSKAGAAASAAAPSEKRSQMAQLPMRNMAPAAAGPSSYAARGIVISDQRSDQRQQRAAERGGDGGYWGNGGFKDVLI
ncbi:hypothetical protein KJ359_001619 [Pestalotiopsis sp. 9143b]|nr:hypothetical protein KJ359_001619 [Pestalotiopsis sp. 9143b]